VVTHHPDDGGSKHSEASVKFYHTTWLNIPEDSHLHKCTKLLQMLYKLQLYL
jgi:hypothetical protein